MVNAALILLTALASIPTGTALGGIVGQPDTAQVRPAAPEQDVIYQRERFVYPTDNRRNPFQSLLELEDAGPQFDDLDLAGVIFGGSAGSVATLIDRATAKRYRIRRGDVIGSARVIEIRPDAVVFQVTEFGVTRSETLRIRKEEEEQA
ncbi:MAG: hypothetical protein JSU87_13115 [Gemmatimonadota bacterium]|nr:MAG: hypothetical protein JSU87_13115 [Gemmatimonadota bacterium]